MTNLRRDFLPTVLEKELCAAGFDGAVTVQACQTLKQTEVDVVPAGAARHVGWAPIVSKQFRAELERLRVRKKLKGLHHVIQDEPGDNYINLPDFNRGITALQGLAWCMTSLICEKHLAAAIESIDRQPNQIFVLNHMAKPRIRDRVVEPWWENISELARRETVYRKLFGPVTEADWTSWSEFIDRTTKDKPRREAWKQGRSR